MVKPFVGEENVALDAFCTKAAIHSSLAAVVVAVVPELGAVEPVLLLFAFLSLEPELERPETSNPATQKSVGTPPELPKFPVDA